jgi:hypothetical protein
VEAASFFAFFGKKDTADDPTHAFVRGARPNHHQTELR